MAATNEVRVTTNYALSRVVERILTTLDEQKRVVLSGVGRHMGTTFVYATLIQQRVANSAFLSEVDLYTFVPRESTEEVTAPRLRVTITTEPTAADKATSAFHAALPAASIIARDTPIPSPPRRRGGGGGSAAAGGSGAPAAAGEGGAGGAGRGRRRRGPRKPAADKTAAA